MVECLGVCGLCNVCVCWVYGVVLGVDCMLGGCVVKVFVCLEACV